MLTNDAIVRSLQMSANLMNMTLGDISDTEILVRPVPNANHIAWQLGHLIVAEHQMMVEQGIKMVDLPTGFKEKFTKEKSKEDDSKQFPTKSELLAVYTQVRNASIAFAQSASEAQLTQPLKNEQIRSMAPLTVDLLNLISSHDMMHIGQFQVTRRKLNRPVLF